jgi:hypothetical protein
VILEYKFQEDSWDSAINLSLENSSTKYATTTDFVGNLTFDREGVLNYRIIANTTEGRTNVSEEKNLSIFWDCSWDIVHNLERAVGGWNEVKNLGELVIVNTGDKEHASGCSLDFDLSYSTSVFNSQGIDNLRYNESVWPSVNNVLPKTNVSYFINVTYKDIQAPTQDEVEFIIKEAKGNSVYPKKSFNSTLINSQSGPYLYQSITKTPGVSLYLTNDLIDGQNPIGLDAYLKNVMGDGTSNRTAYNVTIKWELPREFEILNGSSAITIENVSNTVPIYHPVNLSFKDLGSLGPGITSINLVSFGFDSNSNPILYSDNSTVLNQSILVFLECYPYPDGVYVPACANDPDPKPEESSSSGGVGSSRTLTERIESLENLQLVRGRDNQVVVEFFNRDEGYSISNIEFRVEGAISKYIKISPKKFGDLPSNSSVNVTLEILSPKFLEIGKQEIRVVLTGMKKDNYYVENKVLVLEIHDLSGDEARELLEKSKELMDLFSQNNFSYSYLDNLLNDSIKGIEVFNYELVRDNYKIIDEQVNLAIKVRGMIEELKELIASSREKGINVDEADRLLKLAILSFERNDFVETNQRILDAQVSYAFSTKGQLGKLSYYLKTYPKEIIFSTLGILVLIFILYKIISYIVINLKIKSLRSEEDILEQLVIVVQRECFEKKKMSMEEYQSAMMNYNDRILNVIQNIVTLEVKKKNLFRFTGKNELLLEEKKVILKLITKAQRDYLVNKKLETRTYELKTKSYTKRLGEIEEAIANKEGKKAQRKWKLKGE